MGYRVKFESGESVIFDNEPSIQDIEEAEKSFRAQKSTSLVDKIPDTAPDNSVPSKYVKGTENDLFPKYKTPPSLGEATQDVLDEFIAIPDAAAGVGTALTSGMAGGLLGFYGIADQSSDVNERMSEGARKFSWQPRTEIGQEITQKILEPTMKVLEPLLGLGSSFAVTPMKPFGKGKVLPKVEPKIEPTIKSNITSTLEQENKKVLTRQLKDIQKREAEIQASLVDGTATPELQKEAEALYKKRIKLEQTLFPEKSVEKPIDNNDLLKEKYLANLKVKNSINYVKLNDKVTHNLDILGELEPLKDKNKIVNLDEKEFMPISAKKNFKDGECVIKYRFKTDIDKSTFKLQPFFLRRSKFSC